MPPRQWVKGPLGLVPTDGPLSRQLHQHAGAQRPAADSVPAHVREDPPSSHGTRWDSGTGPFNTCILRLYGAGTAVELGRGFDA